MPDRSARPGAEELEWFKDTICFESVAAILRGRSRFMYLRGSVDERLRLFRPRYSDDESLSICGRCVDQPAKREA